MTTTIFFCSKPNHSSCQHGKNRYLTLDVIIQKLSFREVEKMTDEQLLLARTLQSKEDFYCEQRELCNSNNIVLAHCGPSIHYVKDYIMGARSSKILNKMKESTIQSL